MKSTIVLVLSLLISSCAVAQSPAAGSEVAAAAAKAYQEQRWEDANTLYEQLTQQQATNGLAWIRLGITARHLKRGEPAEAAFEQAQANGIPTSFVDVERAKLSADQGEPAAALSALDRALAAGYGNVQLLETDAAFAGLRDNQQFAALLQRARENQSPCLYRPAFRQFDFWVGRWNVVNASGVQQGQNQISQREGGCYLLEEWTGGSGSTGSSINYYDADRGVWVQQWLAQGGSQIRIEGGLDESGSMVLVGKIHTITNGQTADFRGTWTPLPDGRVRQFFEQSNDDGATWAPWFEGFYSRIED